MAATNYPAGWAGQAKLARDQAKAALADALKARAETIKSAATVAADVARATKLLADMKSQDFRGPAGPPPLLPLVQWSQNTNFVPGPPASFVTYQGSSYACKTPHMSGSTFDPTKWVLSASKGADGVVDQSAISTLASSLAAHVANTNDPHDVTKAQVGLSSYPSDPAALPTPTAVSTALANINTLLDAKASKTELAAAIAALTAGSPEELNSFVEVYNRFLSGETAASAVNTLLSSVIANLANHANDNANPHGVTATQLGVGPYKDLTISQLASSGNPVGDALVGKVNLSPWSMSAVINNGQLFLSDTGWNPLTDRIDGRSTPETATVAHGGHYTDVLGAAQVNYKWGQSAWYSNAGTMPITAVDAVAQGYKVRAGGFTARQCGDDGDAHAIELLIGQYAAKPRVTTINGSTALSVTSISDFRGGRICPGNAISGAGIPAGATVISVTKGSRTYSGKGVESASVASGLAGNGYSLHDIVTVASGGTFSIAPQFRVRTLVAGGGIGTVIPMEQGNFSAVPSGSVTLSGGTGTGAQLNLTLVQAGLGSPDTITISAAATASASNVATSILSASTQGIACLITASGDGGPDGQGNIDGRGIQFQGYGGYGLRYGIVFGASALRTSDGYGIRFIQSDSKRGISSESCAYGEAFRVIAGGSAINADLFSGGVYSGAVLDFATALAATYALRFNSSCVFSGGAAIYFNGQNIAADGTTGMKLWTSPSQKGAFFGATPIVRPASANQAAVSGTAATVSGSAAATYDGPTQTLINSLVTENNKLRTDVIALTTLTNQLRADLVALGLIKGAA